MEDLAVVTIEFTKTSDLFCLEQIHEQQKFYSWNSHLQMWCWKGLLLLNFCLLDTRISERKPFLVQLSFRWKGFAVNIFGHIPLILIVLHRSFQWNLLALIFLQMMEDRKGVYFICLLQTPPPISQGKEALWRSSQKCWWCHPNSQQPS